MENKIAKKSRFLEICFKYVTFFTFGSFLGWLWETVISSIKNGKFISRKGLIYGPFSPIYGVGIVLAIILLEKYRKKDQKLKIFLLGGLYLGIAEYIGSILQEYIFHAYSWDYSNYPLNFQGRTSAIHMFLWGIAILLFMQFLYPLIMKFIQNISKSLKIGVVIIVTIFFTFDITISVLACNREYERYKNIPADSKLDIFLDENYNDKFLKKIYPNKKFIEKKEN